MKSLSVALLCFALAACSTPLDEPAIELPDCNKLRATGNFDLIILTDDTNTLRLSGDNPAQIEWRHDGTTLSLQKKGNRNVRAELSCMRLSDIELIGAVRAQHSADGFAQYEKIAVYGSSSFAAVALSADLLDLRTSGQGALRIDQIVADKVQVLASGNSQQYLAGETQQLLITLTGKAKLSAAELSAQRVELDLLGQAVAEVFPTAHVSGTLGGDSVLGYATNPVLEVALDVEEQAIVNRRE
ncbi:MAG: GIN domain-containing protein [bacterium]